MNAILLCRTREVPTPEQIVEMLCENGYAASYEVEKGLSTKAIVRITPSEAEITKLYYSVYRPPMIIDLECDLWAFLHDYASDYETSGEIESFIFVDATADGDDKVFHLVVNFLESRTNTKLIFWNEYV